MNQSFYFRNKPTTQRWAERSADETLRNDAACRKSENLPVSTRPRALALTFQH